MTDTTDDHHGVPDDLVRQLGRITISAAWVEHVAREIANAYNAPDTGKLQFQKITEAIKERMAWPGTPPWSRTTNDDVRAWITRAKQVMNRRNIYVHGLPVKLRVDGAWAPVVQHARSGQNLPNQADKLTDILDELGAVINAGMSVWHGLLPKVKEGVYLVYYPLGRTHDRIYQQVDGGHLEATDDELEQARIAHNRMLGYEEG